jgi:agmatine deiminase
LSYYVCNGAVICAQFGDHATDAAAKATLAAAFPDRVIETLNIDYRRPRVINSKGLMPQPI